MTEPRALALVTEIAEGEDVIRHLFAGRWYLPVDDPACGAVADIPAEATTDHVARQLVCDRAAGHIEAGIPQHRQVTDMAEGSVIEWPDEIARGLAAALLSAMIDAKAMIDAEGAGDTAP